MRGRRRRSSPAAATVPAARERETDARAANAAEADGSAAAPARRLSDVAAAVLAVMGWRLDHLNAVWAVASGASLLVAHTLIAHAQWRLSVPYFALTLLAYYGGNAAILGTRLRERAIARWGEERAFRIYETLAGLMFLNQGLGIGCMAALPAPPLPLPAELTVALGVVLFAVGLTVKVWATVEAGVDTFFFRDMFVGHATGPPFFRGPYRFLANPMYGVGQLHGYGYALIADSLPGLIAAGIGHLLIYVFYLSLERPFVRRAYGDWVPGANRA